MQPAHPAPHRGRIGQLALTGSLFGAPIAWVVLMNVSTIGTSYACYPHRVPLDHPSWSGLSQWLGIINILCLAIGLFAGRIAWKAWRRTRHETSRDKKKSVDIGEGRTRFLAVLALMSSGLFVSAILFTTCAIWLIPPCKPW